MDAHTHIYIYTHSCVCVCAYTRINQISLSRIYKPCTFVCLFIANVFFPITLPHYTAGGPAAVERCLQDGGLGIPQFLSRP